MLRTATGRIIGKTDSLISNRVFSYRLAPSRPGLPWAFQDSGESWWHGFVGHTVELLKTKRFRHPCLTDVARYFPSINVKSLQNFLLQHRCDARGVQQIFDILEYWHCFGGLKGLPISLEASSALGNVFLRGLDRDLIAAGAKHFRYMDDMFIFAETSAIRDSLIEVVDAGLKSLDLERSKPKTWYFDDPESAIAHMRNSRNSYLGGILRNRPELGQKALHSAFDELVEAKREIVSSEFHYILSVLDGSRDPYGCKLMARDPILMNLDPRVSANYLRFGLRQKEQSAAVVDACLVKLRQVPDKQFQALDLHLLRMLAKTRTGEAEGKEFQRIATDESRPWPVRNFAWHAYAQSSLGRDSVLMEAAREEDQPDVRRAIIAALKRPKSAMRKRRCFLRHAGRHYEESRYTVEWVRAA